MRTPRSSPYLTWPSSLLVCLACAAPACSPPPPDYAKTLAAWAPCPSNPGEGVAVTGAVQRPGVIPTSQAGTLSQALTRAGGLTVFAYRRHVVIRRCRRALVVDVDAIVEQEATDPAMADGDIVHVPERD